MFIHDLLRPIFIKLTSVLMSMTHIGEEFLGP